MSTNGATRAAGKALPADKRTAVHSAISSIEHMEHLIHAAWMAAGSMNGDGQAAERDALQTVIHLAGEELQNMRRHVLRIGGEA